jgi:hypothetical protein
VAAVQGHSLTPSTWTSKIHLSLTSHVEVRRHFHGPAALS